MAVDLGYGFLEVRPKASPDFDRQVQSQFQRTTQRLGGALSKAGKGLTTKLTLPVVALGGLAFREAEEAAQVARLTETALRSTGNAAVISVKQVEDVAEGVSELAAIDDEAIQKTANLALTMIDFKKFGDQADETLASVTQGVFDYAAATGKSEKAGIKLFASIANTPAAAIGQLQKLGVITAEQADKYKAMEEAGQGAVVSQELMAAATARWGGAAAANATPTEKLRVTLANLGESFGTILSTIVAPALSAVAGAFKGLTGFVENLSPAWKRVLVIIAGTAAVIGPVLLILGKLIGAVGSVVKVFGGLFGFVSKTLIPGLVKLWGVLMANPFLAIAAVVAIVVVLIIKNWDKVKAFLIKTWNIIKGVAVRVWNGVKAYFTTLFNAIKRVVMAAWNGIKAFLSTIWNAIKAVARSVWQAIRVAIVTPIQTLVRFIGDAWRRVKEGAKTAWNAVKDIILGVWDAVVDGVKATINFLIGILNGAIGGINTLIRGYNRIPFAPNIPEIPKIPTLGEGGVVLRDTLALIHAGEVVAPLDKIEVAPTPTSGVLRGTLTLTPDSRAYVEAVVDEDADARTKHVRVRRRMGAA